MESFKDFIKSKPQLLKRFSRLVEMLKKLQLQEAFGGVRGWIHKSGKVTMQTSMEPWHVQMLLINPKKYGLTKDKIMKVVKDEYTYDLIRDGDRDVEYDVEYLAMKNGWVKVNIEPIFSYIKGSDYKYLHAAAKVLDKKYNKEMSKGKFQIEIEKTDSSGHTTFEGTVNIQNQYDFQRWLKNGGDPEKSMGKGRSEIGRTMAAFR